MQLPVLFVCLSTLELLFIFITSVSASSLQITPENYEQYRSSKDILLLNFYADWCRFSQALKPIFEKAAESLHDVEPDRVAFGRVDCDTNKPFCSNFHITKYPTLKLIRHGQTARREYRGSRSTEALVEFVKKQLADSVIVIKDVQELAKEEVKRAVIGYFSSNDSMEYDNYRKVTTMLRDDCKFYALLDQDGDPQIVFREEGSPDAIFTGGLQDFPSMLGWIHGKCVPLVREITFQNGEEMTEEGIPLLILFYHPDNPETKELFKQKVETDLSEHKGSVNCVTANGVTFAHPLHHLGKSAKDLPVLAIDSFRHMYVFPNYQDINVPGKLKEFIDDLQSGKLHRVFHYGPDPVKDKEEPHAPHAPHHEEPAQREPSREKRSDPPESTFKNLQPAKSRYSLLRGHHDEL